MREEIQNYRNRLNQEIINLENNLNAASEELSRVQGNEEATNNINNDIASINENMNRVNLRLNELAAAENTLGLIDSLNSLYETLLTSDGMDTQTRSEIERDIEDLEGRLNDGPNDPDEIISEVWNEIGGKPNIPTRESVERELASRGVSGESTDSTDSTTDSEPNDTLDVTQSDEARDVTPGTNPVDDNVSEEVEETQEEENDLASKDLPDEINMEYFNIYMAKIDASMDRKTFLEQEIEALNETRDNETRPVMVDRLAEQIKEKQDALEEFNEMTGNNLVTMATELDNYRTKLTDDYNKRLQEHKEKIESMQERFKEMMGRYTDSIVRGETPRVGADEIKASYEKASEKENVDFNNYKDILNNDLASLKGMEDKLQDHASKLGVDIASVKQRRIENITEEERIKKEAEEFGKEDLKPEEIKKEEIKGEEKQEENKDEITSGDPEFDDLLRQIEESRAKDVNNILDEDNKNNDFQPPAVAENQNRELDDIINDIENTNNNDLANTNNQEKKMSLLNKALLASGGFAVGVGLSCVPGIGQIRMAAAGVKLGTSAINAWAKGHPNGKVATMIKNFKEHHPKISAGIEKIHEKTHSEPLNVFINGMAAGYLAGNAFEYFTKQTVAEAVADHFRPVDVPDPIVPDGIIQETLPTEPLPVDPIVAAPEIPEMVPGAQFDLSGLSQGLISSDSTNYLNLITEAGKDAVFDKEVINEFGQKMWHFKQANGAGYAWFKADDVIGALGKQASDLAQTGASLNM